LSYRLDGGLDGARLGTAPATVACVDLDEGGDAAGARGRVTLAIDTEPRLREGVHHVIATLDE
jgi:hypothetical protein